MMFCGSSCRFIALTLFSLSAQAATVPLINALAQNAAVPSGSESPRQTSDSIDAGLRIQDYFNLRDPFRRPRASSMQMVRDFVPDIEKYPSDQFNLIGVITGSKKNKALVKDPSGKMHIVTEANKIGTRGGIVTRITSTQVLVEEKVKNLLGEEEKIDVVIGFLQKKDMTHDQQDVGYKSSAISSPGGHRSGSSGIGSH